MSQSRARLKVLIAGLVVVVLALTGGALLLRRSDGGGKVRPEQDLWFEDVTDRSGLDFVHDSGPVKDLQMPQIHGSGGALLDFDGDGRLDLYLLNFGGPGSKSVNRLYQNVTVDGNLKFRDVTEGSRLGIPGNNIGAIVGDVNNDGLPDIFLTQQGAVKFFLNRGKGKFEDITESSGVRNPLWGTSCNFFDYDRDGYLDLVIANFVEFDPTLKCTHRTSRRDYCGPSIFLGSVSRLFRNLGSDSKGTVRFEDVTVKAGLAKAPAPGLGVYCADFDGDGWPDMFMANDGKPNHLWINQKNGTFKEEAMLRGIAYDSMGNAQAGMGIAVGDVSGSGLFDIYVTHLATERNTLWKQGPKRGQFSDRTADAGLLRTDWRGTGFGTLMGDFDQDGWPDIGVVNGAVSRGTTTPNPALGDHFKDYTERNQLFRNMGEGKFSDVSRQNPSFCGTANVARGLMAGDLDGDGALDLVVTPIADRARVFRNIARDRGHWLLVRAFDPRLNRDAYGAEVVVEVGNRRLLRIINPGDSYQCSSDPRIHFGLGQATQLDAIQVLWPDGLAEVFHPSKVGIQVDRTLVLRRGEGDPPPRP